MTLTNKLAIAALLAGVSLPAVAQDATSAVSSAIDSTVSGAVSAEASGAVSAEVDNKGNANANANASASADNYGSLISALQTGATADLAAVTESTTINFVTISTVKANGDAQALDNALEKNAEAHAKLTADVTANTTLSAKLTDAGYTADQVVAIVAAADGSLTVYIDDRA
jgi:hypothetical protein